MPTNMAQIAVRRLLEAHREAHAASRAWHDAGAPLDGQATTNMARADAALEEAVTKARPYGLCGREDAIQYLQLRADIAGALRDGLSLEGICRDWDIRMGEAPEPAEAVH